MRAARDSRSTFCLNFSTCFFTYPMGYNYTCLREAVVGFKQNETHWIRKNWHNQEMLTECWGRAWRKGESLESHFRSIFTGSS